MQSIRCAVFGAGHFGRFHARKYAALPGATLVAVVDADRARAEALAAETGARAETSIDAVIGAIDAASVAVPTVAHHPVAARLLTAGVHVLVEKPIAATLAEADSLIDLAATRGRILQVGHLQRFLLKRMGIAARIHHPLYVEAVRIAPFKPRGTDVGVVLDLMIHDIDLILSLMGSEPVAVDAVGGPVLTGTEDLANARLRFANGCVASVTASRVGLKTERRLRIYQPDSYLSIDLAARRIFEVHRGEGSGNLPELPGATAESEIFPDGDDLEAQIADFVACVRDGRPPLVSGLDGRRALATALAVSARIREGFAAAGLDWPAPPRP